MLNVPGFPHSRHTPTLSHLRCASLPSEARPGDQGLTYVSYPSHLFCPFHPSNLAHFLLFSSLYFRERRPWGPEGCQYAVLGPFGLLLRVSLAPLPSMRRHLIGFARLIRASPGRIHGHSSHLAAHMDGRRRNIRCLAPVDLKEARESTEALDE